MIQYLASTQAGCRRLLPRHLLHKIATLAYLAVGALATQTSSFADSKSDSANRPNIVFILADDLGYGDVGCFNPESKIPTPHLDSLAAAGLRMTDAHSPSAVCTPTRYGILTGRYAWRTKLKTRVLDGFDPPLIEPERLTVGRFLQHHGYRTACIGKWHLGMEFTDKRGETLPWIPPENKGRPRAGADVDYDVAIRGGPLERGFDEYFGIAASLNMSPFCFLQNDRPLHKPTLFHPRVANDFVVVDEGVRSPDFTIAGVMPRLAAESIGFIDRAARAKDKKPFFLYTALSAPHLPVVTNHEYIGRSSAGLYGDFVVETDAFVGAVVDALRAAVSIKIRL